MSPNPPWILRHPQCRTEIGVPDHGLTHSELYEGSSGERDDISYVVMGMYTYLSNDYLRIYHPAELLEIEMLWLNEQNHEFEL